MINRDKNLMNNSLSDEEMRKASGGLIRENDEMSTKNDWSKNTGGSLGEYSDSANPWN